MTAERPTPPAGWYPDTERASGLRYWDGASWTEQRTSSPPGPPPPPVSATYSPNSVRVSASTGQTNGLAIASLVTAILGVSIAAIICGHMAIGQIDRTNEGGRGLAVAGLIIGYLTLALQLLVLLTVVALVGGRS